MLVLNRQRKTRIQPTTILFNVCISRSFTHDYQLGGLLCKRPKSIFKQLPNGLSNTCAWRHVCLYFVEPIPVWLTDHQVNARSNASPLLFTDVFRAVPLYESVKESLLQPVVA